jgi:hypothetical protein
MKIKLQTGTSRSGSPALHASLNQNDDNEIPSQTQNEQSSSNNNPQIWTRSAVRAAQEKKLLDNSVCHKHHKHHGQGYNQHTIGKIVKPIPVRPMSSSSSSSSTHSSQFSNNVHIKSIHNNLSSLETVNYYNASENSTSTSGSINNGQNFSLIAKYFASFPATRLAKTSQIFTDSNSSYSTNSESIKSTPFLPFKKSVNSSSSNYSAITEHNSQPIQSTFVLRSQTTHNNSQNHTNNNSNLNLTNTDHLCTHFRRMIKLNEPNAEFRYSPLNNNVNNNRNVISPVNSEQQFQFNSINFNSAQNYSSGQNNTNNESNDQYTTSNPNQFQLSVNQDQIGSSFLHNYDHHNDTNTLYHSASNDEDATTRLGQITMETRSTRKFLIKHHPYLQHNQQNGSKNLCTTNNNKDNHIQRPSINLMKKLNSKNIDEPVNSTSISSAMNEYTNTTNSSSNNRSGRSSRSNNSGLNEQQHHHQTPAISDHNLLKFTDTAPGLGVETNSIKLTNSVKRRQIKNLTTASALTSELNQHNRKITRSNRSNNNKSNFQRNVSDALNNECECECYYESQNDSECAQNDDSCEQYYDEQEEDSSGYYSSYHSVDLISSSGGSCVGGHQIRKQNNWELTTASQQVNTTNNKNDHLQINTDSLVNKTSNQSISNTPNTNTNSIPQHHYHTRSLTHCLEQKQDMQHHPHENQQVDDSVITNINAKNIILPLNTLNLTNNNNNNNNSTNTSNLTIPPTTRLRYQQQLAAQRNHLECDLDLDQIEND